MRHRMRMPGRFCERGFRIPTNNWGDFFSHPLQKKPGSLGYGSYGFFEDKRLAEEYWTASVGSQQKYDIIKVEIEYQDRNLLNFVDNLNDMIVFKDFLRNQYFRSSINNLHHFYRNTFGQHSFDGAALEYYIKYLEQHGALKRIDVVSCATTTDLYDNIKVFVPNGIEYCIRNKDIITRISMGSD